MQENWQKIVIRLQPILLSVFTLGLANFTSFGALEKIHKCRSEKVTKGFDQTLAQAQDTIRAERSG